MPQMNGSAAFKTLAILLLVAGTGAWAKDLDGCWRLRSVIFERQDGSREMRPDRLCVRFYSGEKLGATCLNSVVKEGYRIKFLARDTYEFILVNAVGMDPVGIAKRTAQITRVSDNEIRLRLSAAPLAQQESGVSPVTGVSQELYRVDGRECAPLASFMNAYQ